MCMHEAVLAHPTGLCPEHSGALVPIDDLVVICLHHMCMADGTADCGFQHGLAATRGCQAGADCARLRPAWHPLCSTACFTSSSMHMSHVQMDDWKTVSRAALLRAS
jgi:hypothetical protein